MKFLCLFFLVVLLSACGTPEDPGARHQRLLHEQARENFIRERDLARARSGRTAPVIAARAPAARRERPARVEPIKPTRAARRAAAQDTIYEPTTDGRLEQRAWEMRRAREYLAFEAREARRLGKKPAQLTREERAWIRSLF